MTYDEIMAMAEAPGYELVDLSPGLLRGGMATAGKGVKPQGAQDDADSAWSGTSSKWYIFMNIERGREAMEVEAFAGDPNIYFENHKPNKKEEKLIRRFVKRLERASRRTRHGS